MQLNRILHPTDFSDSSGDALAYAGQIARDTGAELLVMHSAKSPYIYGSDRMMEEWISKPEYHDLDIKTSIKAGDVVPNILNESADLIVLGSKGKSGIEKVLFGSVTRNLILRSDAPLLIIPAKSTYTGLKHITFTTDYHEGDLATLQQTAELADFFKSGITVLHVAAAENLQTTIRYKGFREIVREQINYASIDFRLLIESDFYTGITSFLENEKTDLIVMTRYKKPFFGNLIERDHTQQMGFFTEVPLLILPGPEPPEAK